MHAYTHIYIYTDKYTNVKKLKETLSKGSIFKYKYVCQDIYSNPNTDTTVPRVQMQPVTSLICSRKSP